MRINVMTAMALLAGFLLSGCMLGPDFKSPSEPKTHTYIRPDPSSGAGRGGFEYKDEHKLENQLHISRGADIPQQWWSLYQSSELDRMIRLGLKDSPNLAAASATLLALQQDYTAQSGTILFPAVDASLKSDRQKLSGVSFGQGGGFIYTLHTASVNVSYSLDPFGGGRRYLESLRAGVDYQGFQLEAAHLALSANIVTTAITEASLSGQLLASREIVSHARKQLEIVKRQAELGVVTETEVLSQRTALAQAQTALPPIRKQLAQAKHRLAMLVGRFPNNADMPEFRLYDLHMPEQLPLSMPSKLVHQRPDIRAAEATLHQASAAVGVATANLYPSFSISANFGRQAVKFADLLTGPASTVWGIGGNILQPLFHGGELTARRRQALADFDAARAQYRQTLLMAFQNVADVLLALQNDARGLALQQQAAALSVDALHLVEHQFELGAAGYPALLNAQLADQHSRIGVIQARALLLADTAALFQAMGGGWWHRDDAYQPVSGGSDFGIGFDRIHLQAIHQPAQGTLSEGE